MPVIDIGPFRAGTGDADAVTAQVRSACETIGFFVVKGHGVPAEVIDALLREAAAFFDQPLAAKMTIAPEGDTFGGPCYAPLESESLAATLGVAGLADLKETLDAGPRFQGDRWPPDWPELEAAWQAAFAVFEDMAALMRALFCAAMGLPQHALEPAFARNACSLRALNYPAIPESPEERSGEGRQAHRLRRLHDPARRSCAGTSGTELGGLLHRRAGPCRDLRDQHRRRLDELDQRPLNFHEEPCGLTGKGKPRAAAAFAGLLPQPLTRTRSLPACPRFSPRTAAPPIRPSPIRPMRSAGFSNPAGRTGR